MKKQAKQLRELRNKIIYNGDVPLEFGCEFIAKEYTRFHGKQQELLFVWNNEDANDDEFVGNIFEFDYMYKQDIEAGHTEDHDGYWLRFEILGKPTTLAEILLMMNEKFPDEDDPRMFAIDSRGFIYDVLDRFELAQPYIQLDLTKEIEDQEPEVLDKIIKIIE